MTYITKLQNIEEQQMKLIILKGNILLNQFYNKPIIENFH